MNDLDTYRGFDVPAHRSDVIPDIRQDTFDNLLMPSKPSVSASKGFFTSIEVLYSSAPKSSSVGVLEGCFSWKSTKRNPFSLSRLSSILSPLFLALYVAEYMSFPLWAVKALSPVPLYKGACMLGAITAFASRNNVSFCILPALCKRYKVILCKVLKGLSAIGTAKAKLLFNGLPFL